MPSTQSADSDRFNRIPTVNLRTWMLPIDAVSRYNQKLVRIDVLRHDPPNHLKETKRPWSSFKLQLTRLLPIPAVPLISLSSPKPLQAPVRRVPSLALNPKRVGSRTKFDGGINRVKRLFKRIEVFSTNVGGATRERGTNLDWQTLLRSAARRSDNAVEDMVNV